MLALQRLGQYVCNHLIGRTIFDLHFTVLKKLIHKIISDLNVSSSIGSVSHALLPVETAITILKNANILKDGERKMVRIRVMIEKLLS